MLISCDKGILFRYSIMNLFWKKNKKTIKAAPPKSVSTGDVVDFIQYEVYGVSGKTTIYATMFNGKMVRNSRSENKDQAKKFFNDLVSGKAKEPSMKVLERKIIQNK